MTRGKKGFKRNTRGIKREKSEVFGNFGNEICSAA